MNDDCDSRPADVVPPMVATLLGLSWVVLFAGRWILVQLLLAAGLLSSFMVADLDNGVLIRCYLALVAITVVVLVLRSLRGLSARIAATSVRQSDDSVPPGRPRPASAPATDRRPNTGD